VVQKIIGLWGMEQKAALLRDRISNPKATATAVAKNEGLLADVEARIGGMRRQIEQSATLSQADRQSSGKDYKPLSLSSFFATVRAGRQQSEDEIIAMLKGRRYPPIQVQIVEGGPISNEWQAEVDMAKSMIEEAKTAFNRQAGEAGGYPASVADSIAKGEGIIMEGKPLVSGIFVRLPGSLAVLSLSNKRPKAFGLRLDGSPLQEASTAALMAGEWVYPGTAGYDACITDAAQIEDALGSEGKIENGFSEVVPEVAQRRKGERLASYRADRFMLPQPHFPYVVSPADAGKSEVKRRIFESQKAVVRSFADTNWPVTFVVSGDTAVTPVLWSSSDRHEVLREFATANGLQLTIEDFDQQTVALQRQVTKTVKLDTFKAALTGSTAAELHEQALTFLHQNAAWFDWSLLTNQTLRQYLSFEFVGAMNEAARQAETGSSRPADPLPTDVVGIRGNTRTWKDEIKQSAMAAGAGKFKWDGDALAWNVYRSTWTHLIAKHPRAADELELTKATKTL